MIVSIISQAKIADLPESVDWRDQGVVTMVISPKSDKTYNIYSFLSRKNTTTILFVFVKKEHFI